MVRVSALKALRYNLLWEFVHTHGSASSGGSGIPSSLQSSQLTCFFARRILVNVLYCRYLNKRKTEGKEEKWRGCGDDRDPEFRFVL
jgi:hypothetical protein